MAVGLAWTTVGGEVLLVEANKMEGDGELVLTGHLGDVMKESARLALNWVRTSAREVRHTQFSLLLPENSDTVWPCLVLWFHGSAVWPADRWRTPGPHGPPHSFPCWRSG